MKILFNRIDRKMSSAHTNYRLDEAQAIMSELRTIKKAICTGEKERQDLMQVKYMLLNKELLKSNNLPLFSSSGTGVTKSK